MTDNLPKPMAPPLLPLASLGPQVFELFGPSAGMCTSNTGIGVDLVFR